MSIYNPSTDRGQHHTRAASSSDKFRDCLNDVARHFFGTPNRALSKGSEMRYGSRGSLSVDIKKGVWRDHETDEGGGTLDLVMREMKFSTRAQAAQWLEDEGFIRSDEPKPKPNGRARGPTGTPTKKYHYTNLDAECPFYVQRYENPKDFRPFLPNGKMGLPDDEQLVVYRLPEITEAISLGRRIYICEGEKDVHTAVALGVDATCNQGGCGGGWRAQYNETFRGADVVIVPDNDDAGRKHAENIAASLRGVAATTRILKLWDSWRDCPPKGDLTKWVEAGHTREQFDALVDAAPVPEPKLPFIDMSNWDNEIPPRQEWAVSDRIPSGHVSLFSGEGGAGKSLIMLQWAACHVLGRDWFDAPLKQGPALLIDAEDDEKVIHKRLADIVEYHGVKIADVVQRGLRVASLAGKDAVLATFSHKSGKMEPTPLYDTLLEVAGDIKPVVTGIAASADVFAGDEIDRSQVRQFIAMLTRIAMTAGGAVVLISHPSQSGISSGSGLSGSTAWHNSVRSRFYLKGVKPEKGDDDDDEAPDNDLREIEFRKNNYGPISESITLRYQNGLFLPMTASTADQAVRELEAEQVFLAVLSRFTNQKQYVSANKKAPNYAPAAIARHPDATGFRKTELESAMQRLLDSYSIRIAEEGPAWRKRTYLAAGKKVVL